ncbi:MAG: hypothetical protein GOMPHAMPRED_002265 [Gomphillus americanus]|uniref:Aromatic-L-amino-acid decarboxylase n=1 Tax=Gomphillus americanus TaxID=1940652 RepID=A0A8H3IHP1_9LECA|nr:MAG: hypothetical protein GOMPHAMPRED_002265 [Gomphillus americanus]
MAIDRQEPPEQASPLTNGSSNMASLNNPMSASSFVAAAQSSLDYIVSYYKRLTSISPLSQVKPGYLRPLLPASAPESPEPWSTIQSDIERLIEPGLTHWQSPNFMAFFPASSTYPGMLGELYSAAFTAPAFNWQCSPVVTELETVMMDWMCKLFGLSEDFLSEGEGGGVIQGSASEAVVTCIVAAREKALLQHTAGLSGEAKDQKRAEVMAKLVALGSEQAHSSVAKGALIAGVRHRSIHARTEDHFALTHDSVSTALQQCQNEGLIPFFLSLTLGTTNTCAIDDFVGLSPLLAPLQHELWTHVDAAYAGAALILPKYQHLSAHISTFARSIDVNMHKWLLTNFDASCLFVRRRRDLTDALSITPAYLRNHASDAGLVTDYRDWQIPLGRRFRALKIWFVVRTYGAQGLRDHIQRHCDMGEQFGTWIRARHDLFSVVAGPSFALNVFTIKPPTTNRHQSDTIHSTEIAEGGVTAAAAPSSSSSESPLADGVAASKPSSSAVRAAAAAAAEVSSLEANALTQAVYEAINAAGKIFITSTVVNDVYAIRVVSANPLTDVEHVRAGFDEIVRVTEKVRGGWKWGIDVSLV